MATIEFRYRNTIHYRLVYCELIRAARYRGLTTYQAVAQIMGLPLKGSHMGKEVGQILGEISKEETDLGRPMLSAIVVGVNGQPGAGFYEWARQLGRYIDDEESEQEFWKREAGAVHQTWAREFRA